jgi:beta-1,4-mannosyl-glycoprotein beta-1,4-N-acetylglucosaminyltransferase|tara:strand:- start:383 stop:1192 length:810 start_codon:yes stop_codon:yes gene_type:complete
MAIYDCFQYFNEETVLDLRLNILNKAVDFFVIVESTTDHQGNEKKLNFDINKYKKYEKKIIYVVVDDTNKEIRKPHIGQNSLVEQHQRNSIMRGLKNSSDDDLIIISDVDEIPDLSKLKYLDEKKRFSVFVQKKYDYKLNLQNITEGDWYGSKICKKKDLISPQWLRNLKFKKYPFWRIDKIRDIKIINNAGWHFSYLQSPEDILKKISSFSHGERNKSEFKKIARIEEKIKLQENIFNLGFSYKKVKIDDTFPEYILQNKDKFKDWII